MAVWFLPSDTLKCESEWAGYQTVVQLSGNTKRKKERVEGKAKKAIWMIELVSEAGFQEVRHGSSVGQWDRRMAGLGVDVFLEIK